MGTAPFRCKSCGCGTFQSDFACIGCDLRYEEHETAYETEAERKAFGKPIRSNFMPLANDPEIQAATMKQLKIGMEETDYLAEQMN